MAENPNQDLIDKYREAITNPGGEQPQVTKDSVETQEKESSIQKLKRQRNEARAAVERLTGRLESIEARLGQPAAPAATKDDEVDNLRHLAFTDDKINEMPGVSNQAVLELAKKAYAEEIAKAKEELRLEMQGHVNQANDKAQIERDIQAEFGPEAFVADGELFQTAKALFDQSCQAFRQKYGNNVAIPRELYMNAYYQARSILPKPEVKAEETQNPAPEDMLEGGTNFPSADELATIKAAATKAGNTDDAFKAVARNLYQ